MHYPPDCDSGLVDACSESLSVNKCMCQCVNVHEAVREHVCVCM